MTNQDNFILDEIDPDLGERIDAGRRNLFARYAAPAIALGSAPLILAAASTEAFAAGALPQKVVDVLNFALTLEYLEAAFYKMGNAADGLIPADYRSLFKTIGAHETAHVALLQSALGVGGREGSGGRFHRQGQIRRRVLELQNLRHPLGDVRGSWRGRLQGPGRQSRSAPRC